MSDSTHLSTTLCTVPIRHIALPLRKRDLDPANVERLVDSISSIGLLSPIVVRRVGPDIVHLVAGRHRLEAMKRLGRLEIECVVVSNGELQAELMEIDENLCRAELTPAEEAAAVARRKEIYLLLHPETAAGKRQAAGMHAKLGRGHVNDKMSPTFTKATAAASGKTQRSIERAAARAEAINPENLAKLVGTSLDKGAELDALARMPVDLRQDLMGRAAKGEVVSARATRRPSRKDRRPVRPTVIAAGANHLDDEDAQFARLEAAWNAASDAVRGRFGVEVLHLGSGAWRLPSRAIKPDSVPLEK